MIEPTERLLWSLALVAFVGVVSASIPVLDMAAPIFLGGLLGLCVIDGLWAKNPATLRIQRDVPPLVVGQPHTAHLLVQAPRGADVELTDTWPGLEPPYQTVSARLSPDEQVRFDLEVVAARRGRYALGRVAVRTRGPLGLIKRRARRSVPGEVVVGPDLVSLEREAVRTLRGQNRGGRARRAPREGRSFAMLREYRHGDDVRKVAWKASAKRQELVVKQTEPERHQDVLIALDCGRHMFGRAEADQGERPRLDIAVDGALSLAAAAVELGDRPGLTAFEHQVTAYCPPGQGRPHFARIGQVTLGLDARAGEPDYAAWAARVLRQQKRRALLCLITDVSDVTTARTLLRAVARLRSTHLVWLCAVHDPAVQRARSDADPLVRRAAARVMGHRQKALAAMRALGAVVSDGATTSLNSHIVSTYRDIKHTGRL